MAGMHIRYNTTLKQYEYSLLGTDTGPWTKLDISGNLTGSLPANIAYKDIDNSFVAQTLAANSQIKGFYSILELYATNFPGAGRYRWINYGDSGLSLETQNDAGAYLSSIFTVNRLGVINTTAGIRFPASQVASTEPNLLDDYEEGSWTPTFNGDSGNSTGQVYAVQTGRYVKIGLQVYLAFDLQISSWAVGAGGSLIIMALPFYSDTAISASGEVSYFINCGRNVYTIYPHISPNGYLIYLYCKSTLSGNADGVLAFSELRANMRIIGSVTYRAQA